MKVYTMTIDGYFVEIGVLAGSVEVRVHSPLGEPVYKAPLGGAPVPTNAIVEKVRDGIAGFESGRKRRESNESSTEAALGALTDGPGQIDMAEDWVDRGWSQADLLPRGTP